MRALAAACACAVPRISWRLLTPLLRYRQPFRHQARIRSLRSLGGAARHPVLPDAAAVRVVGVHCGRSPGMWRVCLGAPLPALESGASALGAPLSCGCVDGNLGARPDVSLVFGLADGSAVAGRAGAGGSWRSASACG